MSLCQMVILYIIILPEALGEATAHLLVGVPNYSTEAIAAKDSLFSFSVSVTLTMASLTLPFWGIF